MAPAPLPHSAPDQEPECRAAFTHRAVWTHQGSHFLRSLEAGLDSPRRQGRPMPPGRRGAHKRPRGVVTQERPASSPAVRVGSALGALSENRFLLKLRGVSFPLGRRGCRERASQITAWKDPGNDLSHPPWRRWRRVCPPARPSSASRDSESSEPCACRWGCPLWAPGPSWPSWSPPQGQGRLAGHGPSGSHQLHQTQGWSARSAHCAGSWPAHGPCPRTPRAPAHGPPAPHPGPGGLRPWLGSECPPGVGLRVCWVPGPAGTGTQDEGSVLPSCRRSGREPASDSGR